jgi:hypothetical protein
MLKSIFVLVLAGMPVMADYSINFTTNPTAWQVPADCPSGNAPCAPDWLRVTIFEEAPTFVPGTNLLASFYIGSTLLGSKVISLQPISSSDESEGDVWQGNGSAFAEISFTSAPSIHTFLPDENPLVIPWTDILNGCAACSVKYSLLSGGIQQLGSQYQFQYDIDADTWYTNSAWWTSQGNLGNSLSLATVVPEPDLLGAFAVGVAGLLCAARRLNSNC